MNSIVTNEWSLSEEAKARVLSPPVLSMLEKLSARVSAKTSEFTSGRRLRKDLMTFLKKVEKKYQEELEKRCCWGICHSFC